MRIIARIDIKGENAIKGVRMEGLRVIGKPNELARRYYEQGADEILLVDVVASLYQRSPRWDVLEAATEGVFCPVTYCGGIRSVDDMRQAMRHGADKVGMNTAVICNPGLITTAAQVFGSQAVVVSIEAKRRQDGTYEAFYNSGREASGKEVGAWAKEAEQRGAGEILVTSVDHDGTISGLDRRLLQRTRDYGLRLPVLVAGGYDGRTEADVGHLNGIVFGAALHAEETTVANSKAFLSTSSVIRKSA